MLKHIDKKGLKFKMWIYFVIFAVAIMLTLWLLQIVFLNSYYESMKINEIRRIGNSLVEEYDTEGFEDLLYSTSLSEGIVIQILDKDGRLIYPLNLIDIIRQPRLDYRLFAEFITNLAQSEEDYTIYTREDIRLDNPTLIYGAILDNDEGSNYFLYINSIMQPIDSTVNVLKNQLIIVTAISLGLALVLSYWIAKRLTRPIENITESAKTLAQGDYSVEFQKGDYTEIDNLADTLNYATEELSKTEELRKDLIANVSHDLRTPLTLIKSYGEMIRDISGNDEEKRNKHVKTIIDEADRLSRLVNALLDLSKAQSGIEKMKFKPFNIKKTTESVLKGFNYFIDNEGFKFTLNSSENVYAHGDEEKIEQVIYNLVNNAVDYSQDEKDIVINIKSNEESILFEVIDKGIGISDEDLENIWDRYYKIDNSHRRSRGTGIGLSIVKSILIAHNAQYGVESEVGKGSRFYFELNRK